MMDFDLPDRDLEGSEDHRPVADHLRRGIIRTGGQLALIHVSVC